MLSSLLERQIFFFVMKPTLYPPQRLPLGIPITIAIIEKNRKCAGNDGKLRDAGALFSLSPSHRAPRALFLFLPSLPTTRRGLCGGEGNQRKTLCFVADIQIRHFRVIARHVLSKV